MIKNNYFKSLCIAFALVFAGFSSQAQEIEISGYFNGFLPVAEFNDEVDLMPFGTFTPINRTNIANGATAGLGLSLRAGIWLDVGSNNFLLPFAEASFLWNATKGEYRDVYDDNPLNAVLQSVPTAPNYFNIPLMIGLKYRYDLTEIIRPFAEASLGYDLTFISKNGYHDVTYTGIEDYMEYSYKPSGAMAWSLGAGTYLGENVSVGLYYLNMGSHRMEYTKKSYSGTEASYTVEKRKLGELALRIGFHF